MQPRTPIADFRHPRAGFSLVELLVVMTIMTILGSLAFVTIGASGNAAREAATKTSMRVLSGALRERVDAFRELTAGVVQFDSELPSNTGKSTRIFRQTVADFNRRLSFPLPYPLASEAFVRKAMFKSAFPQRRADLFGYDGVAQEVNGVADDSPLLSRMYNSGSPSPSNRRVDSWLWKNLGTVTPISDPTPANDYTTPFDNPNTESSELLYLILTEGDVYGLPPAEIDGIDDNMIGDTDGDGNLEFLDGWGRPLQFYNWPTRLIKDDGVNFIGLVTAPATTTSPILPATQYPTASLLISNLPDVGGAAANANATQTAGRNRIDRDPDDPSRWLLRSPRTTNEDANNNGVLDGGEDTDGNGLLDRPAGFWLYKAFPALLPTFPVAGIPSVQRFRPEFYHDPSTATMPLVVSAGSDAVLGLYLPTENGRPGTSHINRLARVIPTHEACLGLGDNITNQQRGPK